MLLKCLGSWQHLLAAVDSFCLTTLGSLVKQMLDAAGDRVSEADFRRQLITFAYVVGMFGKLITSACCC